MGLNNNINLKARVKLLFRLIYKNYDGFCLEIFSQIQYLYFHIQKGTV